MLDASTIPNNQQQNNPKRQIDQKHISIYQAILLRAICQFVAKITPLPQNTKLDASTFLDNKITGNGSFLMHFISMCLYLLPDSFWKKIKVVMSILPLRWEMGPKTHIRLPYISVLW
jgi:hypothetical protein